MKIVSYILKIVSYIFLTIIVLAFSEEGMVIFWGYIIKLSLFYTFIASGGMALAILIFIWLPLYNKLFIVTEKWQTKNHVEEKKGLRKILLRIARWITIKHNYYEKNKNKKIVKKIHKWGYLGKHFGLYICGFAPFLFHPGLCAYKIFVQSRFGYLCIWLGGLTRLALYIFCGFRLINLIF